MTFDVEPLNTPNAEARYDPAESIAWIKYKGTLTSEITATAYQWMGEAVKKVAEHRQELLGRGGCIIDFRDVTGYDSQNLATARSKSISMRLEQSDAISAIPTALIAKTLEQEIMVQTAMQLAKQGRNPRVKLVKSEEDAKKFLSDWWQGWKERAAQEAAAEKPANPT